MAERAVHHHRLGPAAGAERVLHRPRSRRAASGTRRTTRTRRSTSRSTSSPPRSTSDQRSLAADREDPARRHAGDPPVLLQLPRGRHEEPSRATRPTAQGLSACKTSRSASSITSSAAGASGSGGGRPALPGTRPIARFLLKRFGLALVTLWLLSVIVFAVVAAPAGQRRPHDPRAALADQDVGRPLQPPARHRPPVDHAVLGLDLATSCSGDLGTSLAYNVPVRPLLGPRSSTRSSSRLVAFVLVVPLASSAASFAALRCGQTDRSRSSRSRALADGVPEFVSAIVLIVIFGIALGWLPVGAPCPPGSIAVRRSRAPAPAGAAARRSCSSATSRGWRAPGTIEALDADYTRTAYLKGLSAQRVIRRHVLRNALLPTIAVVATQTGYLIGGLVVIETLFNYQGIGQRIYSRGAEQGLPDARGGVLTIGIVYLRRDPDRRHPLRAAQPAHPLRRRRVSATAAAPPTSAAGAARARALDRARRSRRSLRSKTFLIGVVDRRCSGSFCAIFGSALRAARPARSSTATSSQAPGSAHRSAPTSSAATCSRA